MEDADFPDMEQNESDLEATFKAAADFVTQNASVMQQDDLLYLYGRYKQSTVGTCTEPMPGILKFRSRSKWNSWNDLRGMTKEEAMKEYVEKITLISPEWDEKNKNKTKRSFGPVSSICQKPEPDLAFESKTVFDFVKEGNLDRVEILVGADANCADENGLSLLHWACDRGEIKVAAFLISKGANVDAQDRDGQTPLHYASSCGHGDVVTLLVQKGASTNIFDSDGLSPIDVAYSTNIKELLTTNAV